MLNRTEQIDIQICHSEALAEESIAIREESLRANVKRKSFFSPFPFSLLGKPFSLPRNAFTLAEVLITLGIIGVVAAMTIPTLMQNTQEKATVTALKKAYAVLTQAYTLAVQDEGTPDTWGLSAGNSPPVLDKLAPYLRVDKNCTDGSSGCWTPGVNYKYLATSLGVYGSLDGDSRPKLRLVDGTLLRGYVDSPTCGAHVGTSLALSNVCGRYYIDINGYKPPNQIGKDLFQFWLTMYGIIPYGSAAETFASFVSNCKDKDTADGNGCAAWVIYNENMDYLKCNYLDWNGKKKCD